ncbi:hypothetical protein [Streptomyces griseorubiginosus]|uniref:hypothetical protein n=1 Tax=Streptomyces griseorubiginosus TaxID=67304 RepID=UPI001140101D|nr:hypothetical protein [Streptomyces griseorubiginosus]
MRPLGSRSAHRTLAGVFLDLLCCHCLLRVPWSATAASRLVPEVLRQSAEELGLYFGPHVPDGPEGHGAAGRRQLRSLRTELARRPSEDIPCPPDRNRLGTARAARAALVRMCSAADGTPHTAWLRSAAPLLLSELASLELEFGGGLGPIPYHRPATALAERRALVVAAGACTETWLAASAEASAARTDAPSAFLADPVWLTGVLQRTVVRLGTAPLPGPVPDVAATATAEVLERCAQGRRFDLYGTPL